MRRSLLLVVCVSLAGGCGSIESSDSSSASPQTAAKVPTEVASISPLAEYLTAGMRSNEVSQLIDERIADCMRTEGFEYPKRSFEGGVPLDPKGYRDYMIEHGPGDEVRIVQPDELMSYIESLSPDEQKRFAVALDGPSDAEGQPSPGGCVASARAEVGRIVPMIAASEGYSAEQQAIFDALNKDVRLLRAKEAHLACLAANGLGGADGNVIGGSMGASREQRTVDLDCRAETLWSVAAEIEPEYVDQLALVAGS